MRGTKPSWLYIGHCELIKASIAGIKGRAQHRTEDSMLVHMGKCIRSGHGSSLHHQFHYYYYYY